MTGPHDDDDPPLLIVDSEAEYLGDYPTVEAYFQRALEDLLHPGGLWLLDCLDMAAVGLRFEASGRFRYLIHGRKVYRERHEP